MAPYYGQGVYQTAQDLTYYVRSHQSPAFGFCVDVRKPGIDWNLYRRWLSSGARAHHVCWAITIP